MTNLVARVRPAPRAILLLAVLWGCAAPSHFVDPEADIPFYERVGVIPFESLSQDRIAGLRVTRAFFNELLALGNAIILATLLPISVAGVGVREGVAVALLGALGVPAHQALWVGTLGFGWMQPPGIAGQRRISAVVGTDHRRIAVDVDDAAGARRRMAPAFRGHGAGPAADEDNDIGGIDVGFLVLDTVVVDQVTQLGRYEILAFDDSLLNDRPPLLLEGSSVNEGAAYPFAVLNLHGRSLGGITSTRTQEKRLAQAQSAATIVQDLQEANPDVRLIVTGDLNAFEFSDGYVDVVGQISGNFDPAENLRSGDDLVEPDLINQVLAVPATERYSFIFGGNAQVLDHALTSSALDASVRSFSI